MVNNAVILAGGAGKRLWPTSMNKSPKQFMQVIGNSSLFEGTLNRAVRLGMDGLIYVVTHVEHLEMTLKECGKLSPEWRKRTIILAEPEARNTAPALALAAAVMELTGHSDETVLVMAADHLIDPQDAFNKSVELASREAANGNITLYGIVPSVPATGFGYIETGSSSNGSNESYTVLSFREKPDLQAAQSYLKAGNYYWNSGMFTWRNDVFVAGLHNHSPAIAEIFSHPDESWFIKKTEFGITTFIPSEFLIELYGKCPSISIDYAIMEKARNLRMVKGDFQWNDVGSWDVIAELDQPPKQPVYSIQSSNNFVSSDIPVALCGVENLIVVVANDRVMICQKGASQLVKEAAEQDFSLQFKKK